MLNVAQEWPTGGPHAALGLLIGGLRGVFPNKLFGPIYAYNIEFLVSVRNLVK